MPFNLRSFVYGSPVNLDKPTVQSEICLVGKQSVKHEIDFFFLCMEIFCCTPKISGKIGLISNGDYLLPCIGVNCCLLIRFLLRMIFIRIPTVTRQSNLAKRSNSLVNSPRSDANLKQKITYDFRIANEMEMGSALIKLNFGVHIVVERRCRFVLQQNNCQLMAVESL